MLRRLATVGFCAVLGAGVASSTTVIPPTFDQLVSNAQLIFVGEVANVHSIWEATPRGGRSIVSIVTLRVEDVWKGSVGSMTQLEFLGGEVDGMVMEVVGMPTFRLGQRDVLFVGETVRQASPLVGFMHGRFRVERNSVSGVDRVRTFDGRGLGTIAEIGANLPPRFEAITPMRLDDFKVAVQTRGRAR
jgi:hypothetical protein